MAGISEERMLELGRLDDEIADLGVQLAVKKQRVLEILKGRTAVSRGKRFIIERGKIYEGGMGSRLMVDGPVITKSGAPHARSRETSILSLLRIES